jgi:DNA repair protein SbcD/Mre11
MITFFHTADTHFGVENYGKIDKETGIHSRLLDFKGSLSLCVDQAIEEKVDFLLFCGDAYKTAYPTPTQQKLLLSLFVKLYRAGIPVVIVVGNHDHPLSFGKAHALDLFASLPLDGFHIFSKPEILKLETKNGPIQIVGVPWPSRHNLMSKDECRNIGVQDITKMLSDRVGTIIQSLAEKLDPSIPAVLAGHLTVSTGLFSGSEKCAVFGNDPLFLPSQLAIKPFDYIALGHLHRHQNLNKNGYPAVVYSGSLDRIDFGERKEKKGFCRVSVDLEREERASFEFIPIKTRPFVQIEVHLAKGEDQTEQIKNEIEAHEIDDAILKIVYHIPDGIQDQVDLFALQRACASAWAIASIIPVRKVETRERRISLQGERDIQSVLKEYLTARVEKEEKRNLLLKKATDLYQEVYGGEKDEL